MTSAHDPGVLPAGLPVPKDDGAARHLTGMRVPPVALAATDDEIMDTRYGNTTLVHETLGTSHIYYKQDHTFTGGNWILNVSGKWDISDTKDGKQICLHWDSTPLGHPNPECDKIEHHNIGDTWTLNGCG